LIGWLLLLLGKISENPMIEGAFGKAADEKYQKWKNTLSIYYIANRKCHNRPYWLKSSTA